MRGTTREAKKTKSLGIATMMRKEIVSSDCFELQRSLGIKEEL